ncbi:MAG: tetratricopeptide repeat protein [Flavobacteriales bacterium]|nr:tetratricopeptide repeat protein [Flavobacteriales bacterium]MCB9194533.1 tetratricopeptide repeat protein [Flavobacteriales bacterium]
MRFSLLILLASGLLACGRGRPYSAHDMVRGTGIDSFPEQLQQIEARIVDAPDDAALYVQRAALYRSVDSVRQATNDWMRAVTLDSTNASYRIGLGDIFYERTMVEQAEQQFRRAMALDPNSADARFRSAEIQLVLRNYRQAMDLVNDGLRIDPNAAQGYFQKGWIYMETGDTTRAISSLRTAVEQDPGFYSAFVQLGLLSARKHDPLALQYYNTAIALRPNSVEALYNKGMFAQENGMDSLALDCYDRIKTLDPDNALAWYNSGWVHMEHLGDPRKAVHDFSKALDLETNYYQAWYNRGVAMERLGSLDSAAADYQVALVIRPDYELAAQGLQRLQKKGAYIKLFEKRKDAQRSGTSNGQ